MEEVTNKKLLTWMKDVDDDTRFVTKDYATVTDKVRVMHYASDTYMVAPVNEITDLIESGKLRKVDLARNMELWVK